MGAPAKSVPTDQQTEAANPFLISTSGAPPPFRVRQGVWSQGPVYKQLDADFLQRPLIPRAPPTPRLNIDHDNGSLRVVDPLNNPAISELPESEALPMPALFLEPKPGSTFKLKFQILAILAGFAAGLAAALLLGWL